MSKLWIIIFLLIPLSLLSQDTIEDKKIVGVVKVYETTEGYYTQVTYIDTTSFKYSGFDLYDILIRSYLDTYPMLYPHAIVEAIRRNLVRFKDKYYEIIEDPR